MALCPKCNFESGNEEQCERCGIIFDKMHTIFELQPLGAIPAVKPAGAHSDPRDAPTRMESPRVVVSDAGPPARAAAVLDRDATNLDVPLVPRVPQRTRSSFAGPMIVLLLVIVGIWGALEYRQSRARVAREAAAVSDAPETALVDDAPEATE